MTEPRAVRLGLSIVAACTSAVALYAILRVGQAVLFPEADPALVIWSEHAGFFWRALTAGYLGGMAGFATWLLAARFPDAVARLLGRAIVAAAVLAMAQGILVP